ncbi:MAG TPA: DUF3566 domain-containing protein [Streptosporangiaceae bacterium]|nr:DUF3566 domain-containing protein [Streptosporangiaceae bacterium]
MGSEEDGVDEAGRSPEPPVIVAPPGLDVDPEVKAPGAVTENGVMASGRDARATAANEDSETSVNGGGSYHNGTSAAESARRVPFPADDIGRNGSSAELADNDDHSDGTGTGASGVFDTGRHAVSRAMAATSNWFSTSPKSDSASDEDSAAASRATSSPPTVATPGSIMAPPSPSASSSFGSSAGERRPSFTASSTAATPAMSPRDTPPAPAPPSAPPAGPSGSSSLWREVRPQSAPSSAPTAPGATTPGIRPGGPGTPAPPGARPPGPGTPGTPGSSGGPGFTAAGAASAVGGAAAGLATSVASAFQGRNTGGKGKRKRHATVRRSSKRQAQLTLSRVEPWSVMKFSFVVSVVAFIILFVAVAVLYMVLSALGVFTSLQHTVSTITSSQGSAGTNISNWFSASRILGYTGMLGALNIVLITAISTIGAVIYNLIASTIGGVEVTLRETD